MRNARRTLAFPNTHRYKRHTFPLLNFMTAATSELLPQHEAEHPVAKETDQQTEVAKQIEISLKLEQLDSAAHLGKTLKGLNR